MSRFHFNFHPKILLLVIVCNSTCDVVLGKEEETGFDIDRFYGAEDIFQFDRLPKLGAFIPSDTILESEGAIFGKIVVLTGNVFNTKNPKENNAIFRLANKLHTTSKDSIILAQLLFKSGEKFSRAILSEAERNLRSLGFLYDARIVPVAYHNGQVDIAVITRDLWTLSISLDYSREGGENKTQVGIKESNLFGYGNELQFDRGRSIDREKDQFLFKDDNIYGSRNNILVEYSDNSDGDERRLNFERPFYSLNSDRRYGFQLHSLTEIEKRFTGGDEFDSFAHTHSESTIFAGISAGLIDHSVTRWNVGFTYLVDQYGLNRQITSKFPPPENGTLSYPWVSVEIIQDKFVIARRLYRSGGVEDVNIGSTTVAKVGFLNSEIGSDSNGYLYDITFNSGVKIANKDYFFFKFLGGGRVEDNISRNIIISANFDYFKFFSRERTYALKLRIQRANLFINQDLFTLGGDSGLRGYPIRYQAGNKQVLLSLESHYYLDYHLFQIFRVGGVIFFDIGRAWDADVAENIESSTLADVGFGLRLSSTRTNKDNVLHIDAAYPLVGETSVKDIQFSLKAKRFF